ncbi:MAG: hypothetical protein K6B74_08950 [Ruminococcus sp.]|nr:hypothetical protein [Ruminococcus sp.]
MKITRCDSLHYYDSDKYNSCPFCKKETDSSGGDKVSDIDTELEELKLRCSQKKKEALHLKETVKEMRNKADRLEIELIYLKKKAEPSLIKWADKRKKAAEDPDGEFESAVFHNENNNVLGIYLMEGASRVYAEECVKSLNALPPKTVIEICKGIIKCAKDGGENKEFELPLLDNAKDILNYCWFTDVYAVKPKSSEMILYVVSGEGDWGETVYFAIGNETVAVVGADYTDSLDWLKEYVKNRE